MVSTSTESTIVPIFIKREDGKSFKQMKSKEIAEIVNELEEELGLFEKGGVSIATGGDLFIRPATKDQQLKLLKINYVHKGKIMVTCKLPNAASGSRVTIHQVPLGDTDEEIYHALQDRGYKIVSVYRFKSQIGLGKAPTPTVALEFEENAPSEITLNGMMFKTRPYIPGPPRCSKRCQRLGHTSNHCREEERCNNCGSHHEDMTNCQAPARCINCEGKHPASSPSCPKFLRMKQATRPTTTAQGRSPLAHPNKHLSYSQALGEPSPPINHETEILKGKVEALQTDLAGIKAELAKVKTLEAKVGKLDTTVNHVRDSLATLEKGQQTSNSKLDRLVLLLAKLLPDTDTEDMDTSQPEETRPVATGTRPAVNKSARSEPAPDPATKKLRSGTSTLQTTKK